MLEAAASQGFRTLEAIPNQITVLKRLVVKHVRNLVGSLLLSVAALSPIAFMGALPAAAQQSGLVNVGNVSLLNNVSVGVRLTAAANVCGVNVGVLSTELGQQGSASCTSSSGPVTITKA